MRLYIPNDDDASGEYGGEPAAIAPAAVAPITDRPSIVVPPFDNLSHALLEQRSEEAA